MILEILIFIFSAVILFLSGIYMVLSLKKLSNHFGISTFTASFIIAAVATSIPELFVGISSAFAGTPELSLGNILGANILNLTLAIGVFTLLNKGIKFRQGKIGDDVYFMFFSIILLVVLYLIGNSLSRTDGVILLFLFFFNFYRVLKKREKFAKKSKGTSKKSAWKQIVIFYVSLIFLFFSSNFVVGSSLSLAKSLGVPEIFIGLFVLSFITILPEFIFGLDAIFLKQSVMSIGNQTGTVFANIALILGIVSVIHPIQVSLSLFFVPVIFLLISAFSFTYFQKSGRDLSVKEGISLLFIYLIFALVTFLIGR